MRPVLSEGLSDPPGAVRTLLSSYAAIRVLMVGAMLCAAPSGARAQEATVFAGLGNLNGPSRAVGVAIGHAPSVAGFELEFFATWGRVMVGRPAIGYLP